MDGLRAQALEAFDLLYRGADHVLAGAEKAVPLALLHDFVESVTWREPFIVSIFGMHFALWIIALLSRRRDVVQFGMVAFLVGTSVMARTLNEAGKRNWKRFATQDYFDSNGTFLMVFVLGPFFLLANVLILNLLLRLMRVAARASRAGDESEYKIEKGKRKTS